MKDENILFIKDSYFIINAIKDKTFVQKIISSFYVKDETILHAKVSFFTINAKDGYLVALYHLYIIKISSYMIKDKNFM